MKKIVILGWFGKGNFGDNAILQSQVNLFIKKYPGCDITVFCGNKGELSTNLPGNINYERLPPISFYRLYEFFNVFYFFRVVKILRICDIFVLGGGGFFSDRQKYAIPGWLRYGKFAYNNGAKVIGFGMGVGPFFHDKTKYIVMQSESFFSGISVRDTVSKNILQETGFESTKIYQSIDPALFLEYRRMKKRNIISFVIKDSSSYFTLQLREILEKTDYEIRLIIMDNLDKNINNKIFSKLAHDSVQVVSTSNLEELYKVFSSSCFVVSQRLHGSIISFTQNTPFLNLYYHHKGKELGEFLKIGKFSIDNSQLQKLDLMSLIVCREEFEFNKINLEKYKSLYFYE